MDVGTPRGVPVAEMEEAGETIGVPHTGHWDALGYLWLTGSSRWRSQDVVHHNFWLGKSWFLYIGHWDASGCASGWQATSTVWQSLVKDCQGDGVPHKGLWDALRCVSGRQSILTMWQSLDNYHQRGRPHHVHGNQFGQCHVDEPVHPHCSCHTCFLLAFHHPREQQPTKAQMHCVHRRRCWLMLQTITHVSLVEAPPYLFLAEQFIA